MNTINLRALACICLIIVCPSLSLGQEMIKYESLNEPKAKGIHLSISYPSDWKAEPGERANIVQRFTSEQGRGLEVVTVMVKDIPLPPNTRIEKSDIDEIFSAEGLSAFIPKGGKAIKLSETKIDGERAGYVYYIAPFEKANMQLITKAELYIIFYKSKFIIFTFSAGRLKGEGEGPKLAKQFENAQPIFQRMAVSIVLNDKWKK